MSHSATRQEIMSFNPQNSYTSIAALQARTSRYGYLWASDVDDADAYVVGDGDEPETAYAEEAIEYANQLIDEALAPHVAISPRPSNPWLSDRAVDIAAARLFSLGGREIPKPFDDAAALALDKLAEVRDGSVIVPGLDYTQTTASGRRSGWPIQAIRIR